MSEPISKFIFTTFRELFGFINPFLSNYHDFSKNLSREIRVKAHNNIQYQFDVVLDNMIKKKLDDFGITGKIFSEESGFFQTGNPLYRVVFDPFCNSSLASRTFHEAAVGITIFSYQYDYITSAIMDYQTGLVALVEDSETNFYQIQTGERITPSREVPPAALKDAWVVFTLENSEERKHLSKVIPLVQSPKRIILSSGHIYWLKLALGAVDAYLDPFGGERLYEMFAATVAQAAGCVVTSIFGEPFDPVVYLKIFEANPDFIFYPVAARNRHLHRRISDGLFLSKT